MRIIKNIAFLILISALPTRAMQNQKQGIKKPIGDQQEQVANGEKKKTMDRLYDPNEQRDYARTERAKKFRQAISEGNLAMVKKMVEEDGVNPDNPCCQIDTNNENQLSENLLPDRLSPIPLLRKNARPSNIPQFPLLIAADTDQGNIVHYLLSCGADHLIGDFEYDLFEIARKIHGYKKKAAICTEEIAKIEIFLGSSGDNMFKSLPLNFIEFDEDGNPQPDNGLVRPEKATLVPALMQFRKDLCNQISVTISQLPKPIVAMIADYCFWKKIRSTFDLQMETPQLFMCPPRLQIFSDK